MRMNNLAPRQKPRLLDDSRAHSATGTCEVLDEFFIKRQELVFCHLQCGTVFRRLLQESFQRNSVCHEDPSLSAECPAHGACTELRSQQQREKPDMTQLLTQKIGAESL